MADRYSAEKCGDAWLLSDRGAPMTTFDEGQAKMIAILLNARANGERAEFVPAKRKIEGAIEEARILEIPG